MQFRTVPKNKDKLSVLGFGCMRLPLKGQNIDEERAKNQIRSAIDNGVNYVDSAPPYHGGESEKVLGKALLGGYREKVKVATKLTPFLLGKAEDMNNMLSLQLKKLQTDHVDYYLLHGLEEESWKKLLGFGVFKFLEKAIKGLKYAASKNLAVMIMEPLRGGTLADKLPDEVTQLYDNAKIQRSPAEWGLRWVWNHPQVTLALSGMNDEKHIAENIKSAETQ